VTQRLLRRNLPEEVRVVDFGIRGLDLTYALLDGYEGVILVDAVSRGGAPGTRYVIEPEADATNTSLPAGLPGLDMHAMDPAKVLGLVRAMGGQLDRVLLVGCEALPPADDLGGPTGLSGPVRTAVEEAVVLVEQLAAKLLQSARPCVAE
jgi:hydrogenase maturation protease